MPVAALVLLALGGGLWSPATANLIRNGGFEEAATSNLLDTLSPEVRAFYPGTQQSPVEGWNFGGGWEGGRYTVHQSDLAHRGKHSVEIRCETKGRGGIASSPFTLLPGSIVKVSFWVKAAGATGGRIFLNWEGTPGDGWNKLDLPTGTYDWTPITHRCVVPVRNARADGQTLVVFLYSKAAGSVWVDDFAVEEVDVNALAEAPDTPALRPPQPKPIPEPPDSPGYRVDTASSLVKVFPDTDYAAETHGEVQVSLARNEYEDFQVIVEAPWRAVRVRGLEFAEFRDREGHSLPRAALSWRRVDFVETMFAPAYPVDRVGLYPDPLMPPGPFTVEQLSRVPLWVTVRTQPDTPAGVYRGTVTLVLEEAPPTSVPVTVTVWDFALPNETHLRTLTWLGMGVVRYFYGLKWGKTDSEQFEKITHAYQDLLLEHRLGPGGEVASRVHKGRDGHYDFSRVDATLERLFAKGMNAFIMGTAPNLKRQGKQEYTPEFIAQFTDMMKAYGDHLREKGWIDRAYVYTYDEAPRSAWPEVKKIAHAIKQAAPELRVLQCLNQPEGVKALEGSIDVFDVYVAQYDRTGVADLQQRGTEVWLAVCCYPADHPNLFTEYPLLDARIIPLICWKRGVQGFEYWSPTAWGKNWRKQPPNQWPDAPWDPNTFGRYNGDGHLLYPGPEGEPYPSIRLKALRDGFEDYEYLWQLRELVRQCEASGQAAHPPVTAARKLLALNGLIADAGSYSTDNDDYFRYRQQVAETLVALRRLATANGGNR